MKTTITSRQRSLLQAGIRAKIRHYQQCMRLIDSVDAEVFSAGMAHFATEAAFGVWLCAPAVLLNNKVPLTVARTGKGRREVALVLRRLAHGLF